MSDPTETPVIVPVETPEPSGDVLGRLTPDQRSAWLKTGELPGVAPVETSPDTPAEADATPAPAETPEKKPTGKPRSDINARLGQLAEQRRIAEARAEAAEKRAAELEAKIAPADSTPTEPAAAATAPSPRVYQTPKGPVDFTSDDPQVILDQFIAIGYADPYAAMNLFTPKAEVFFAQQAAVQADGYERDRELVNSAFEAVKTKHPDWDPAVLDRPELDFPIPAATARLIFDSSSSADVLYHLSQHPDEARALAAMEPLVAARALGTLEATLSVVPSTPATRKTVSSAPDPSLTLGSRHQSSAGDDLEDAMRTGDTRRYIELANQRELTQRRNGGRR